MKSFLTSFFSLFLLTAASAQGDCSTYFTWLQPGKTLEYTYYNRKEKELGTNSMKISSVAPSDKGATALVQATYVDAKGKNEPSEMEYEIHCAGDKMIVDMSRMFPTDMLAAYEGMDVAMEIEQDGLEVPANMSIGQELDDGNCKVDIDITGVLPISMSMTMSVTNRKVAGQETVTTPAGTFDCYVITYDQQMKMMATRTSSAKEWWAPAVGMIQMESYDKNGKLDNRSVLSKIEG